MNVDLNCDLGEGEPPQRTRALMRSITSANVACGGHAGDVASMTACVQLCKEFGVRLGAHPGPRSRTDFGRGPVRIEPAELELLLLHQVSALTRIASEHALRLHHIKLHGALYHATEMHQNLARVYLETVRRFWPRAKIFARAGGRVVRMAPRLGLIPWEEAFADRAYRDDGTLVPRTEAAAVLRDTRVILSRVNALQAGCGFLSVSGRPLSLQPQTLCIHSDGYSAAEVARSVRNLLRPPGK